MYHFHLLVALEHRWGDEGLLAQVALVLLVAVVHHLDVDVERVLPLEGRVALVTLERPLTWGRESWGEGGALCQKDLPLWAGCKHEVITHSRSCSNLPAGYCAS